MDYKQVAMKKLRIVSYSQELFKDRAEAGKLLAVELIKYRSKVAVVQGIPRGGIIVANEIAQSLEADLDIVLSRKLGAPGNPELAIGSISEDGQKVFIDEALAAQVGADKVYIEEEKRYQLAAMANRVEKYRKIRPKVPLKDKIVIVTDDGAATGATMKAALWASRQENPQKLIAALPVATKDIAERLAEYADEIVVLGVPAYFAALSQFYIRFEQTTDDEVVRILQESTTKVRKE